MDHEHQRVLLREYARWHYRTHTSRPWSEDLPPWRSDNWDYYNNGNQYGLYTSGTVQSWTIRRTGTNAIQLWFDYSSGIDSRSWYLHYGSYIRIRYGKDPNNCDRDPLILEWRDMAVSYGDLWSASGTRAIENVMYNYNPYTVGWIGPVDNNAIWGCGTWVEHNRDGAYDELTRKEAPWFGTSPNLVAHHAAAANKGKYTYIWMPDWCGDRINGDDHLWWYYRPDGHTREDGYVVRDNSLVIGADPGYAGKSINIDRDTRVTPWEMAVSAGKIHHVATIGRWKASTLRHWFLQQS